MTGDVVQLFHPAFVHFSVAFLTVGGVCEAVGILSGRQVAERFGAGLVLAGTISLLPTVVSGLLAQNFVDPSPRAMADLVLHERTGLAVLAWFLIAMFWKAWRRGTPEGREGSGYAIVLLAGVGLVIFESFLGGRLVYVHALGVAGP